MNDRFGPDRNYSAQDHGVIYGTVDVTGLAKKKVQVSEPKDLKRDAFFLSLQHSSGGRPEKEVFVFVHGFNNSFDDAVRTGARFSSLLKSPVLVFDWCSRKQAKAYTVDECNAEWSLRHFQLVMQGLEEAVRPERITLISHSMGNRIVYAYLQMRHDKSAEKSRNLKEVVLASPDVDRATFKNYFYKVANSADKIRLYVSAHDKPMRMSKFVHLYNRLGDGRAPSADAVRWELPGAIPNTETINFTALDKKNGGWLGHHIPFSLIVNMHNDRVPGPGLDLESSSRYKGEYRTVVFETSTVSGAEK